MGEHYAVAQYMIEQGALSITGIQDIAALKIQVLSIHMYMSSIMRVSNLSNLLAHGQVISLMLRAVNV